MRLFVPNNDLDAKGGDPARVAEVRVAKHWRPVLFDSSEPVLYVWRLEFEPPEAAQVCAIASRLYQLGRGIDMAWASGTIMGEDEAEALLESHPGAIRRPGRAGDTTVPCPGTLDSLVDRYLGKRRRLRVERSRRAFRQLFFQPPKAVFGRREYNASPRRPLLRLAPRGWPLCAHSSCVGGASEHGASEGGDA